MALRIIGLRWGLPYALHPDESVILATVEGMSWSNLNPGFFNYPGFFIYQVFLLGRLVAAAGGEYADLIYTARFLTAMYGWATIWFVYLLGVSLGGRRLGTIAAGLFAVLGAATLHAHYAVTDTPAAALATATVWLSVRSWQRGSYGGIVAAAALAGLAVSTKYSAAPVCLVPWLGLMALAARDRTPIGKRLSGTVVLAALALAAFFVTSPYTLLDAEGFVRDMGIESRLQAEARPGLHIDPLENPSLLDRGLVINGLAMAADMGVPAFLLALLCLGLVLARFGGADAWEDAVAWGMTGAWVLLYYAFMAPSAIGGQRYLIPVYPVMMVLTAGGIEALADRLTGRSRTTGNRRDRAGIALSSTRSPTTGKTGNAAVWALVVVAAALPAW
ncbi:MAG: glycosyltransferase family 39 protein, partial [Acidobacteria bacterium]|nr:glycosyltransferase family 39 protein [Acidobacteriota bacterium]